MVSECEVLIKYIIGAKFGGYGSFLPTYQRSPSWSHTKSPAEAHNYESPRKPHTEVFDACTSKSILIYIFLSPTFLKSIKAELECMA